MNNEHKICPECHNEIDPEVCWCGMPCENHYPPDCGHNPIPMGCTCGYQEQPMNRQAPPFVPKEPSPKGEVDAAQEIKARRLAAPQILLEDEANDCTEITDRLAAHSPEAEVMSQLRDGTVFRFVNENGHWIVIRKKEHGIYASLFDPESGAIRDIETFFSASAMASMQPIEVANTFYPATECPEGIYKIVYGGVKFDASLFYGERLVKTWFINDAKNLILGMSDLRIRKYIRLHEDYLKHWRRHCKTSDKV